MDMCRKHARSRGVTWGFILGLVSASLLHPTRGWAAQASPSKADLLQQMSASLEALVRKVSPSVVQVMATGYAPLDEKGHGDTGLVIGRQRSIGSGVIIDPERRDLNTIESPNAMLSADAQGPANRSRRRPSMICPMLRKGRFPFGSAVGLQAPRQSSPEGVGFP